MKKIILGVILLLSLSVNAGGFQKENHYNKIECKKLNGNFNSYIKTEKNLPNAFIDCETDKYVYEGEWATKSYEAVGQALWYSSLTGKKPGIIFYMKKASDFKYVLRAKKTLRYFDVPYSVRIVKLYK